MPLVQSWRRSGRRGRVAANLFANFAEFFRHFLRRPVDARPIESHSGRAVLKSMCAMERWQATRQSIRDGLSVPRLHSLPGLFGSVAVQMRMTTFHLGDERA